jgi:hypothetical protein
MAAFSEDIDTPAASASEEVPSSIMILFVLGSIFLIGFSFIKNHNTGFDCFS